MNPDDSTSGFRHAKVVMFINEQMSKNSKGPEFYLENLSLSWEVVEEKLKVLLESSEVPREVQEACAWGSLALGIRFAFKQAQLQGRRVQWLHDFASLHRSAAQGLTSDLKKLTEQQEMERKEAAYQLQLAHTKLAEVQRDRDLMRLKLLHAELRAVPVAQMPIMTSAPAVAVSPAAAVAAAAAAAAAAAVAAAAAAATGAQTGPEIQNAGEKEAVTASRTAECIPEKEMDGVIAMAAPRASTVALEGSTPEQLSPVEKKTYPLEVEGQEEGGGKSMETPKSSASKQMGLRSSASAQPVNIQLPVSFTYSYESPFPVTPTPSPPPSTVTEPQMPPYFMATDMNMSETEGPTVYLQDPPKDSYESRPLQQRKTFCIPGDWDCPWCKSVNLSKKDSCFRCGRQGWLSNSQ
ncbi:testis-expressed protein 13A isoform X1 [Rattus norvegicus]|uniref:testis-expressed protein 13A isoform X1 n=1 Tax=Rattus norvegicus TaxID=10116 RepID=UPI0008102BE8|nr:testis-expressed protein 13B isoform X2 [Rattus norvegicus]|eukprot:XP_017457849.1 PREDICTED: testis-expressed sequence 13A protein isoform X2 [Rattus norvegicus]